MTLLQQIQEAITQEESDLGSILLKLRLLAARLNSDILGDWVRYESEGYPQNADVPQYRIVGVTYRGTFSGPFGSGIQNAQIPPYLIEQYASKSWTNYEVRESIAAIGEMVKKSKIDGGSFGIDASNLILLLQSKIYEGYACNDLAGTISPAAFYQIQQTVRSKILELTIELEKSVPGANYIAFDTTATNKFETEQVQQISQQIIYGNVSTVVVGGANSNITVSVVTERDNSSFINYLIESGIPEKDATDLVNIMANEQPDSHNKPFGQKASDWIAANIKKAAEGTWNIGISIATKIITEAACKYYGLK